MNEHPETTRTTEPESDDLARILRAAGPRPTPPQADYDAVFTAAHSAWRRKLRVRRQRHVVFAAAASVLAAVGTAMLWPHGAGSDDPVATLRLVAGDAAMFSARIGAWAPVTTAASGGAIGAGDRIRTADAAGVEVELMPNVSLRLAGGTELEIAAPNRLRLVTGTAYVDSGDESAAVTFETRLGTLRDIGTQFEVQMTAAGLRLRVRSGRVELRPMRGPMQLADAEEQLELDPEGHVERSPFSRVDAAWRWAERLAVITLPRGRAHIDYLAWIAAETGRELRFESESARLYAQTYILDGDPSGYTPAELLEIIERSSRLDAHRADAPSTMLVGLRDAG
jgi:FecR protein